MFQLLFQSGHCKTYMIIDRCKRNIQHFCYLLIWHSLYLCQEENVFTFRRQCLYGQLKRPHLFDRNHMISRSFCHRKTKLGHFVHRNIQMSLLFFPETRNRFTIDQSVEPGFHILNFYYLFLFFQTSKKTSLTISSAISLLYSIPYEW